MYETLLNFTKEIIIISCSILCRVSNENSFDVLLGNYSKVRIFFGIFKRFIAHRKTSADSYFRFHLVSLLIGVYYSHESCFPICKKCVDRSVATVLEFHFVTATLNCFCLEVKQSSYLKVSKLSAPAKWINFEW